jgi:hypothetical protein
MTKERKIEILEYDIANLEEKILAYGQNNISQKKIDRLEGKKGRYEQQLAEILA